MGNENRLTEFRKIAISLALHKEPARVVNASGLIDFRGPVRLEAGYPLSTGGDLRSKS